MLGLLLVFVLPFALALGAYVMDSRAPLPSKWEVALFVSWIVCFFAWLFGGASLLANHIVAGPEVARIEATRSDLADARASGNDPLELAAIQARVQSINGDLAAARYWDGTVFEYWAPDRLARLAPIR